MKFSLHKDVFRPAPAPAPEIPFGVRSVGYYKVDHYCESARKILPFTQLFWCRAGAGTIIIKGRARELKKNQAAVLFPGMLHRYYAGLAVWELHWLTLDGPLAEATVAAFGLEAEIRNAGVPPDRLFLRLRQTVCHPARQSELRSSAIAFEILSRIAGSHHEHCDPVVTAALEAMHQSWNDPAMNLKKLAADLAVGYNALCARFARAMGVSPAAYLKRLRMQNALTLLKTTRLPVGTIAAQCGYADTPYFCRAVRHVTGHAPGDLRRLPK